MSDHAISLADSASGPPPTPALPPPGTPTIAQWKEALKKVRGAANIRSFPPLTIAIGSTYLPIYLYFMYGRELSWLKDLNLSLGNPPEFYPALVVLAGLFWFGLICLMCWPFIVRVRTTMTRRLRESRAIARLLSGELELNDIDNYVHPWLRRFHRFPQISSPEDQLLRLIREADWFVNPPRRIGRLAWLSGWLWLACLIWLLIAVPFVEQLFLHSHPGQSWRWLPYLLALPASAGLLLFFAALSSSLIRDFCVPLWGRVILSDLERELERLEPTPKPSRPDYRIDRTVQPKPDLAKRLGEDLTTGMLGNSAVPWAIWGALTSIFMLIGLVSSLPGIALVDSSYLPLWNLLCMLLLLGLPLLMAILDARRQVRVVRAYLVHVDAGFLLAMRHDTRLHTGPGDHAAQFPGAAVSGSTEQALVDTASELGAQLTAQRGSGFSPISQWFCLGSALLAVGLTMLAFLFDEYGDFSMIPPIYLLPAIGLAFVNAPFRRRMIIEELVRYTRRSLVWDGEAADSRGEGQNQRMNATEPRKLSPLLVILLLCCALCVVYALGALLLKRAHSISAAPQASKLPPGMVFHGNPIAWRALPGYAGALSSLSPPRLLAGRFLSTSEDSLLLLGPDGSVRIVALDGTQAASWQSHADEQSLCCAWDWDGDGLDEVLINELKPGGGERVVAYKADGTLLADEPDLALSFRCAPADLDGDGHSEMFFAAGKEGFLARNAQGEVVWRLSDVDLDGLIKAGRFRLPLNGEPRLLGAADSNADGKFELLIQGGHSGSFLLAGLDGAPLSFDPPALDPYHVADLDSDGRSELIDPERGVYDITQQRLRNWHMPGWSTEELIDGLHSSAGDFGPQLGRCALVLSSPGFESRLRAFDAKGELLYDEKLETSCHCLTRFEGPQGPGVALLTGTSLLVCP